MNGSRRIFALAGVAVVAAYVAFTGLLARRVPPVNTDEVVRVVFGLETVHHRAPRYTLYDDVFAPSAYTLRDVIPEVSLTIYHVWLGSWARFNPDSYFLARLSSIAAGALAFAAFFALGASLGGPRVGFFSLLLAAFNPLSLLSSCLARPETLLLFSAAAILWLVRAVPDRFALKPLLLGFLSLLQMSIHPNGCLVCAGVFIVYLSAVPRAMRWQKGALFVAGAAGGLVAAFSLVDPRRLWLGMHTAHSALLRPPIFIHPWHPWAWLQATLHVLWSAHSFYVDGNLASHWRLSVQLWWVAAVALWMAAAGGRLSEPAVALVRPWGLATLTVFVAMVALVKAKECLYGTNFFPFLIPVMAAGLAESGGAREARIARLVGSVAAIASVAVFLLFCRTSVLRTKPYEQIVRDVEANLPAGSVRIAAPSVLWFGWNDKANFRDSGAILVSHWYTGKLDLDAWMGGWRPDVLILDDAMQATLRVSADSRTLEPFLHRPVDFLGFFDTGAAYGSWAVYRVHWDGAAKNATIVAHRYWPDS